MKNKFCKLNMAHITDMGEEDITLKEEVAAT